MKQLALREGQGYSDFVRLVSFLFAALIHLLVAILHIGLFHWMHIGKELVFYGTHGGTTPNLRYLFCAACSEVAGSRVRRVGLLFAPRNSNRLFRLRLP